MKFITNNKIKILLSFIKYKFNKTKKFSKRDKRELVDKIRINIITPSTNIHGGTKRLITIADYLYQIGYDVKLLRQYDARPLNWYKTDVPILDIYYNMSTSYENLEKIIPDADILLNYGNNKYSKLIAKVSAKKGIKYALFMHFGVHDRRLDIDNARLKAFNNICTTKWISEEIYKYTKEKPKLISFGVYNKQFTAKEKCFPINKFIIGSLYHKDKWKRSTNVIDAYLMLRKLGKFNYKLIMFGQVSKPDLPNGIEYFYDPKQEQISSLYSRCHAWIMSSDSEGIGMCGVESMLTKTPLITTHSGGGADYCTEENCTFIKKNSVKDIFDKIEYLKNNYKLAIEKADLAYKTITGFRWEYSIKKIENIFHEKLFYNEKSADTILTIGIPIHNQIDYVRECINSIYRNTTINFKLILIDDNSNNECSEYLRSMRNDSQNILLIRNSTTKGFPHNCNLIISNTKSPYICILNSDTIVTQDWIEPMLHNLRRDPRCMMVGPSTSYGIAKNYDKVAQQLNENFSRRFDMTIGEIDAFASKNHDENFNLFEETEYLNGFCMVFKYNIVREIGFFDTIFGLGSREEVQYIDRIRMAGYRVKWVKDSYVHHFGHRSFKQANVDDIKLWSKNKAIYQNQTLRSPRIGLPQANVLIVYNGQSTSSTRKRTFEIAKYANKYIQCDTVHFKEFYTRCIKEYGIIIMQRIAGLNEVIPASFLDKLKRAKRLYPNIKFVYDIDDLVIHSQNNYPLELIAFSDVVICTTKSLKESIYSYNKNIFVAQNGIDYDLVVENIKTRKHSINSTTKELTIASFSLAGAGIDKFNQTISILKKRIPHIKGVFYSGEKVDESKFQSIKILPKVSFLQMIQILMETDFTINFGDHHNRYFEKLEQKYGLHTTEKKSFINAKSGLKYYNAAVTKTLFFTSPEPKVYKELINDGINGFIFHDINNLCSIILNVYKNQNLIKNMTKFAEEEVLSKYSLNTTILEYLFTLQKIEELKN